MIMDNKIRKLADGKDISEIIRNYCQKEICTIKEAYGLMNNLIEAYITTFPSINQQLNEYYKKIVEVINQQVISIQKEINTQQEKNPQSFSVYIPFENLYQTSDFLSQPDDFRNALLGGYRHDIHQSIYYIDKICNGIDCSKSIKNGQKDLFMEITSYLQSLGKNNSISGSDDFCWIDGYVFSLRLKNNKIKPMVFEIKNQKDEKTMIIFNTFQILFEHWKLHNNTKEITFKTIRDRLISKGHKEEKAEDKSINNHISNINKKINASLLGNNISIRYYKNRGGYIINIQQT